MLVLAVVFAIGALLFLLGTAIVRRERRAVEVADVPADPMLALPPWTADLAGTNEVIARELRVDMIERLAMIGEPWCVELLERARTQDPDTSVRDAAENALIVVAARAR
jgi:hypothetical protein